MSDPDLHMFNPNSDGEDYVPHVPNLAKRAPERVGKPRAAQRADIAESMDRIVRDIIERDRMRDGSLRWR